MKVRVTILVENTTPVPELMGEYGFSALIEVNGKRILFDTGQGQALMPNLRSLGIDLTSLEALVISHGHFDHAGGVLEILTQMKKPVVYAHSGVFTRRIMKDSLSQTRSIGVPFTRNDLGKAGALFTAVDDFYKINEHIYITGFIPRHTDYEDPGGLFYLEVDGELIPDSVEDDMAMIIDHPQGLIIVSGCAHAGIINMINYAREQTGKDKVLAFIGGTHLMTADEHRMQKTIADLKRINPQKLIVCHCTGFSAASRLAHELPSMTVKGETGMVFEF